MECPYCKREMEKGILSGDGRANVTWKAGDKKTGGFDRFIGIGRLTAVKSTLTTFTVETYFCPFCKKMIIDTDITN